MKPMKILSLFKAMLLLLFICGPARPSFAETPKKIVSLNLCADQYLMALAEPTQVSALTHHARNPSLSFQAEAAQGWPVSNGGGEDLMQLQPDLIIASKIRRPTIKAFLDGQGIPVIEIGPARSYDDVKRQLRKIADAIGRSAKAEALIKEMDDRLNAVTDNLPQSQKRAAHYQRRGFVSGNNTLFSDIMDKAGLINIATELGANRTHRVSMETLIASKPEILIVSSAPENEIDMGEKLLDHPALRRSHTSADIIDIPESLIICGGPSYPAAVEFLANASREIAFED